MKKKLEKKHIIHRQSSYFYVCLCVSVCRCSMSACRPVTNITFRKSQTMAAGLRRGSEIFAAHPAAATAAAHSAPSKQSSFFFKRTQLFSSRLPPPKEWPAESSAGGRGGCVGNSPFLLSKLRSLLLASVDCTLAVRSLTAPQLSVWSPSWAEELKPKPQLGHAFCCRTRCCRVFSCRLRSDCVTAW